MTNGFALNHDKNMQIYFFCVKRQAKNDSLKDVKSTVGGEQNIISWSLVESGKDECSSLRSSR